MLTLGSEYEDTWAPSPDQRRGPSKRVEQDPGPDEEIDVGDPEDPSWKAVQGTIEQKYDTVLQLDGVRRTGTRDGVRQAVWKHDTLNNNPLSRRCDTHPNV